MKKKLLCGCTHYCYGENKAPESLKDICYVRSTSDVEIELKREDGKKFATHLTEEEYREKCKPRQTEIDGDARLIEECAPVRLIDGPPEEISDEDLIF
jgi:hypothetical protein